MTWGHSSGEPQPPALKKLSGSLLRLPSPSEIKTRGQGVREGVQRAALPVESLPSVCKPPKQLRLKDIAAKCTLGCPILDSSLRGGVPCGCITEFVGESTAGKTQACLRLLVTAQWPLSQGGLDGASLYIHTEGHFPRRRLQELASCNPPSRSEDSAASACADDLLDGIFVESVFEMEELWRLLERIPSLLRIPAGPRRRRVRLIVLDSIAALFRSEFENLTEHMSRRSGELFRLAGTLKRLASEFNIAVVVTNQVMDCMSNDHSKGRDVLSQFVNNAAMVTSMRQVSPALGLAWSNCVTTRVFLSRCGTVDCLLNRGEEEGARADGDRPINSGKVAVSKVRRRLQVIFSPYLPHAACDYVIDKGGLRGLKLGEVICLS